MFHSRAESLKSLGEVILLILAMGILLLLTQGCSNITSPSPVANPTPNLPTLDLCLSYVSASAKDITHTSFDSVSVPACRCFALYPNLDFARRLSGPEPKHNRGTNRDAELSYVEILHKNSERVRLLKTWCKG